MVSNNSPHSFVRIGGVKLSQVYPSPDSDVGTDIDIIAIHGLDTDSATTWVWKQRDSERTDVNWLKDANMLPRRVPAARIFTCDWPASLFKDKLTIEMTAKELARSLLLAIQSRPGASPTRPLLFIASCLGGIILIQAMAVAAECGSEYNMLWAATRGIVFLATPFRGTAFQEIAAMALVDTGSARLDIVTNPIPLQRAHVLMNKFYGPEDLGYHAVAGKIEIMVGDMRQARPIDQANAWIRNKQYSLENLRIERLSGELLPMDRCYINLAIIEQLNNRYSHPIENSPFSLLARLKVEKSQKGKDVTLSTLFEPRETLNGQSRPSRILIRGRAGVGKTTLCKKIVYEFTYGELWVGLFDYVLWVPLRNLKLAERRGIAGYNFQDLFCHEYFSQHPEGKTLASALWRALADTKVYRILFILDGLDEVSQDLDGKITKSVKHELTILAYFAFTGMNNDVIDFQSSHRDAISEHSDHPDPKFSLDDMLERVSFLRSSDYSSKKRDQSYHFLHLTFQEYFAARYFVQQWVDQKPLQCLVFSDGGVINIDPVEFLKRNKYNTRYDIFWRFVAGLLNEGGTMRFFQTIDEEPRDILGPAHQRLVMHCLSEVPSSIPKLLRLVEGALQRLGVQPYGALTL
ncbi:hypothetical protein ONZ43_g5735 [Nemania bipapillata]|uniref:Uncharacterized protein n=1 Tax=Nemania bipapillata TaxID=110536 RepID=A0ACC2I744_9PEZI|nr:hypothetical protein ONZ43_g5735 [Nemania bipapillata]